MRMSQIPIREASPNGLHQRYRVLKTDGEPVDSDAIYFVLRLDGGGEDLTHLEACREAARKYCEYIFTLADNHPLRQMADELWVLVNKIESECQ